jgi:homocitrate synthase
MFPPLRHYKGIIDSTLREGRQYRFANFSLDEQVRILALLTDIGVDRVELGNPASPQTADEIRALARVQDRPRLLCHVRNKEGDLQAAAACGIEGVNILCTIQSDRLELMKISLEEYLEQLRVNVAFSRERHLEVRVSVEDFFRSDRLQAVRVLQFADQLGVDRIGIADTLGAAMPWDVDRTVRELRKLMRCDIEVHFHNDLGQANSNALSAVRSGANWVDTTLLGIGERIGITALSVFLISLYQVDPGACSRYCLRRLTDAENEVAAMIQRDVPLNLPTNRENGFSHKAGIHLNALIHLGPSIYEPYSPEMIGNARHLVCGTSISGKTTLADVRRFQEKYGGESE